jgi:tetratricopeptide (TPR) repeat protein
MGRRPKRSPAATSRAQSSGPWIALVVLLVAGYVALATWFRFTQDDAFISLRYARNLVEGHGLVFNEGERVEGYSNFLWTLLLALVMKLGMSAVPASQWIGIAFGAGAVVVTARFARALEGRWGIASVAAAAFVALNPALALWSTGGLETAMFTFLVALGLERSLAPGVGPRGRALGPIVFVLLTLTRPEGPLLFAACFAVRAFDTWRGGPCAHERGRAGLLRDLAIYTVPLLPYAAWKLWYFGDLLPNPFYAKTGWSFEHLRRGWEYTWDLLRSYGLFGVAPLIAVAALRHAGRRGVESRLLAIGAVWSAYVVLIGGDVLYLHRFWLHLLPLAAVLLARGVTAISAAVAERLPADRVSSRSAIALLVVASLAGVGLSRNLASTKERRKQETGFVLNMTLTGSWLGEHLPPGSTIAITTIGAISFYSRLRVIDMLGLTDREIARNPRIIEGITDTWREIQYNAESVLRRGPDAILFSTSIRPSSAAEKALFFYEWFLRAYYPYYFRSVPNRMSIQNCFMRRPDAPPFEPTRFDALGSEWVDLYSDAHLAKSKYADNPRAIELFRRSAEGAPAAALWPREWWGVAVFDSGDTTAAIPILEDVAARDPFATVARARLANHALNRGDFAEAKRRFEEMRAVDPDDHLPWVGLAEILRMEGDLDRAYEFAAQAVRLWDADPSALLLHGILAAQHEDYDVAAASFRHALEIRPEGETADYCRQGLATIDALRRSPPTSN